MVMAAVTVALAMRVVGILLIGALMVIPVISAVQFGASFKRTAVIALAFSLLAVFTGLFASFYANLPSGGAIVVMCLVIFAFSLVLNRSSASA
jgi:zinc transport system permease protein